MPPSSHYLNLLNLTQPGDDITQDAYAAADLSKELELFTNSSFLDQESAFFPTNNYASSQYDLPTQPQQQGSVKRSGKSVSPTIRSAFAPAQTLDLNYMFNTPTAQQTLPSAAMDLSSHEQKRKLAQMDFTTTGGIEVDAFSPSTPGGSKMTKSLEEEDKRRRNTQASARFRVKKKQREQALQETAKQMTDKCTTLESRVKELELENKWLRNLLKPTEGQSKETAATEGQ
ncbi:hypothetical protein BCR37DRAFT_393585 [Protomyces lactucae-debilis]|uniref:BZIP domain-containing protein n=1 Tax=Protomyces lactucae-debilis TaxID=2754530 RepID=A0A1Y2FAI9_PROLT|nr:uncharacterized protein BCR37DRAFT_393585 [Protomyces lactucae-debilis]ORY80942.1 hypothetical protein BCR37DRAFT_393585 [Protomyces lactucae-debilis]